MIIFIGNVGCPRFARTLFGDILGSNDLHLGRIWLLRLLVSFHTEHTKWGNTLSIPRSFVQTKAGRIGHFLPYLAPCAPKLSRD